MVFILATISVVTAVTLAVCNIVFNRKDIHSGFKIISSCSSNKLIVDIDEPEMYEAVEIYLSNKLSSNDDDGEVIDSYEEQKFKWEKNSEAKTFKLTTYKRNKDMALQFYLPYIKKEAKLPKEKGFELGSFILECILFVFISDFLPSKKEEEKTEKEKRMDKQRQLGEYIGIMIIGILIIVINIVLTGGRLLGYMYMGVWRP